MTTTMSGRRMQDLDLRCPSLPQTLSEVLNLIQEPDSIQVRSVTRIIERDPAVCAQILRRVNSAFYGLRPAIQDIERCVIILGPIAAVDLVTSMGIIALQRKLQKEAHHAFKQLIDHCLATAFLSRHLTDEAGESTYLVGNSFLAGLLHDFGRVVLFFNFPKEASRLYARQEMQEGLSVQDVLKQEEDAFGFNHLRIGAYAAQQMDFPDMLSETILFHQNGPECLPAILADQLLAVVTAANLAAKAIGFGFVAPVTWEEARAHSIWADLTKLDGMPDTPEATLQILKEAETETRKYIDNLSV